jgi:hypothetical protein
MIHAGDPSLLSPHARKRSIASFIFVSTRSARSFGGSEEEGHQPGRFQTHRAVLIGDQIGNADLGVRWTQVGGIGEQIEDALLAEPDVGGEGEIRLVVERIVVERVAELVGRGQGASGGSYARVELHDRRCGACRIAIALSSPARSTARRSAVIAHPAGPQCPKSVQRQPV